MTFRPQLGGGEAPCSILEAATELGVAEDELDPLRETRGIARIAHEPAPGLDQFRQAAHAADEDRPTRRQSSRTASGAFSSQSDGMTRKRHPATARCASRASTWPEKTVSGATRSWVRIPLRPQRQDLRTFPRSVRPQDLPMLHRGA